MDGRLGCRDAKLKQVAEVEMLARHIKGCFVTIGFQKKNNLREQGLPKISFWFFTSFILFDWEALLKKRPYYISFRIKIWQYT